MKILLFWFHRLTRLHRAERRRDVWFQEEARAERSSNFIRIVYLLAWVIATGAHAPGNSFYSNLANLGVGGVWLVWGLGYHAFLLRRAYRPPMKYLSTSVDMIVITAMLFTYQFNLGPAYSLKVPTFLSYFCCLGLAALRFRTRLAVFGGGLAIGLYGLLFLYFLLAYDIRFGNGVEHVSTMAVSPLYVLFNVVYLAIFTILITFLVHNVKRLVSLRVREAEFAHRATERASMAAGVAHEIKNPLEGIYGAAQILRDEGKGNRKFIEMILKDAVRLNGVVQQFLQFSRPFRLEIRRFDVLESLREFCQEQNDLDGGDKVRLGGEGGSFLVEADPEGMRQILLNLCQNARRFQADGRPVGVMVERADHSVEIAVEDEGPGVPEQSRHKLFSPFYTTSSRGTGLGLALSRKIAREMGGDVYFVPKNPGSRFVLVLKAHDNQPRS